MGLTCTWKGDGTASNSAGANYTVTVPDMAFVSGVGIVVAIALESPIATLASISGVTWNGEALTLDATGPNVGTYAFLYSKPALAGGTGSVVVSVTNPTASCCAVRVLEVPEGHHKLWKDVSVAALGLGTVPASGNTPTTSERLEILVTLVVLHGLAVIGGTWTDSFADCGGELGTSNGGLYEVALNVGYRIVTAPDAYAGGKTGARSDSWVALLVAYKAAPTKTPYIGGQLTGFM